MPFTEISGLKVFQFKNLSQIPWFEHGISTRDFGDIRNSANNRRKFFQALGIKEQDVVDAQQVHGNQVAIIDKNARGKVILQTDALLTQETGVPLLIKVADCPVILLADRKKKVIGAVHAGWKGTAQEVTRLTVQHTEDHFGTKPADLVVGIGPSIGPCCYEVDTPVIEAFKRFPYQDKIFSGWKNGKAYLNLALANKFQLIETGVKEKNIEIANLCTFDNSHLFFSERREKPTGRFGAVIWIKE